MSQDMGRYTPSPTGTTGERSTSDTAKEQAAGVGQSAKQAGGQVAATATDQAKNVVGEAKTQVRDLAGEARSSASQQASAQQQKAASGVRSISDELRQMAEQGGQSGVVSEAARQAAQRAGSLADWLEQREPADLLEDLRSFARRRPGAFLVGAAIAGAVAGRLTRGAVDAARQDDSDAALDVRRARTGTGYAPSAYGTGVETGAGYGTAGTAAAPGATVHGQDAVGAQNPRTGPLAEDATTGYDLGGGPASGYGSQGPVRP